MNPRESSNGTGEVSLVTSRRLCPPCWLNGLLLVLALWLAGRAAAFAQDYSRIGSVVAGGGGAGGNNQYVLTGTVGQPVTGVQSDGHFTLQGGFWSFSPTAMVINPANTLVWTNLKGGKWSVATNWKPNQVPGFSDDVAITLDGTYTVTLDVAASINSLMLGGSSGTQTLNHTAGSLTLSGVSTGSSHGAYLLAGGILSGAGRITLAAPMTWTGGMIGGTDASHPANLVVTANGGISVSGPVAKSLVGGLVINAGAGTWSGGAIYCYNTAVWSNAPSGVFQFQADGTAFTTQTGSPRLANAGTLRKSALTGTTTVGVALDNSNLVDVQTGTLSLTRGGTSSGTFQVAAGATLDLGGGTHNLVAGSSVTGPGNFSVGGGTANLAGNLSVGGSYSFDAGTADCTGSCTISQALNIAGTVIVEGTGTITPTSLDMSGGVLSGFNPVTVSGPINWTGGMIGGTDASHPANLVVTANGGISVSGPVAKSLVGGLVINAGAGSWSGGAIYCYNTAVWSNAPNGVFQFQADGTAFTTQTGSPRLANAGTLRKSALTGTTTVGVTLDNSNLVDVQIGTLSLTRGGTSSGAFQVAAGATLDMGGGTHNLVAGSSVTGPGNFRVGGGTANLAGNLSVGGSYSFDAGMADCTGSCTITQALSIAGTVIFEGTGTITPTSLNMSGGVLSGFNPVTVSGPVTWTGGIIGGTDASHPANLVVTANGGISVSGPVAKPLVGGLVINAGAGSWSGGAIYCYNTAVWSNAPSGVFQFQADGAAFTTQTGSPRLANAGTLRKSALTGTTTIGVACNNTGTLEARSGILYFSGHPCVQTAGSTVLLEGRLQLDQGLLLAGGLLAGTNTLTGSVTNTGGIVSPGTSAGVLTIAGNYTQTSGGSLQIELGGSAPGTDFDQLVVSGNATLGGTLNVSVISGFSPPVPSTYNFLTAGSRTGTFATFNYPTSQYGMTLAYATTGATLTVTGAIERPTLSVQLTASNTLVVSWLAPAEGWLLESTNALPTGAVPWPAMSPPYQTNAGIIFVNFPNTTPAPNQFFRLHKP